MPRGKPTGFYKGHPKYSGRKKGTPNKFTTLKNAFLGAFEELGGQDYLIKFAQGDKYARGRFLQMISTMLPKDVQLSGNLDMRINNIKEVIDNASGKPGGVPEKVPDGTGKLEEKPRAIS